MADPEEWPTLMHAFERLDEGDSYRSIAAETEISITTLSRLADRGQAYYEELIKRGKLTPEADTSTQ